MSCRQKLTAVASGADGFNPDTTKAKAPAKKAAAIKTAAAAKPVAVKKFKATPKGTSDKDHLIGVIEAATGASKKAAKETLAATACW